MNLHGEILKGPKLRFDYTSPLAEDTYPKRGLIKHGPYDSNLFGKDEIRCTILSPKHSQKEKNFFIDGLKKGEETFGGFKDLFKIPLKFIEEINFQPNQRVDSLIDKIPSKNPDIVFVLLHENDTHFYRLVKSKLLGNGIPNQMVTIEKLRNPRGRQYILENIALASYAKVGGTPWTVSTSENENNLILGVSRAQDHFKKYLVGFVTLFTNDGDFLFLHTKAPVVEWDNYIQGLANLIESAVEEYRQFNGIPNSIIVHFHKRPGKKEIEAIEAGLKNIRGDNIPYAIIHLNEYSNFRLFDSSHRTYTPFKGLKVNLSFHEYLLLLDGRTGNKRHKVGIPRVIDVRIDKRSTLEPDVFPNLIKQVYDFSHINWRGFNATAIPVTLNYSKLIADMVVELGIKNWNQIVAEGKLRDKAWFL